MKIELTRLITGSDGRFPAGTILNLDAQKAKELIDAGAAIEISEQSAPEMAEIKTPETAPEPETAVIKTRRHKK